MIFYSDDLPNRCKKITKKLPDRLHEIRVYGALRKYEEFCKDLFKYIFLEKILYENILIVLLLAVLGTVTRTTFATSITSDLPSSTYVIKGNLAWTWASPVMCAALNKISMSFFA